MSSNTYSAAERIAYQQTTTSKLDRGRVVQVKPHERGDNNIHIVKARIAGQDVDEVATLMSPNAGSINIPEVDDIVLIGYLKGESPVVLGQIYNVQDKEQLFSYEPGERRLGQPASDSNIFFDQDGNVKVEYPSDGEYNPSVPGADLQESFETIADRQSEGRDRTDYTGNWVETTEEGLFVGSEVGGQTYGVGESFSFLLSSDPSRSPPYSEHLDMSFQPSKLTFNANLHQAAWNEPYNSAEATEGHQTEAYGSSKGVASLNPLGVSNTAESNLDGSYPLSDGSKTQPRTEGEPFTDEQLSSPTQMVEAESHYPGGTDYRSYQGDEQVVRLLKVADESMTEENRVELRVDQFTETGVLLEWFTSDDEPDATWNDQHPVWVTVEAYR